MTNGELYTRRGMVLMTAGAAVAGIAGCTGSQNDGQDGSETSSMTGEETHEDGDGHNDEEEDHEEDANGHNHDEGELGEPSATAEVMLQTQDGQHHYAPHAVWVERGGTVTWTNESGRHDVVSYHPDNDDKPRRIPEEAAPWSTSMLSDEGATFSHTFETEGVYDYYCTPHEAFGMVGTVIVGNPDPHEQPALEDPQSSLPDGAQSELTELGTKVSNALEDSH